ncbi:hypothetical protein LPY66_08120 [Dehalobacter sp. DCM]|uniref:hypothetical protein n=1 Tax=Dehalobacter sp. DCM TaxID=2907827 RepID=UPI003081F8C5|nr:hypothetical protein LPY66_08120 [Dehalobacter sp. DCM]
MLKIDMIVPEPLCPSSDLLKRRINDIIALNFAAEEIDFAITVCDNVSVCTPEKVAELAGHESELEVVSRILQRRRDTLEEVFHAAELWSQELETAREPLREAAEGLSLLMTPVLKMREELKCHGKCPKPCELNNWIKASL